MWFFEKSGNGSKIEIFKVLEKSENGSKILGNQSKMRFLKF